jgi:hypothetical protein
LACHFDQRFANTLEAYSNDLGCLQSGLGVGLICSTPQASVHNVERIGWSQHALAHERLQQA